jgi:YHS domain-containing protein
MAEPASECAYPIQWPAMIGRSFHTARLGSMKGLHVFLSNPVSRALTQSITASRFPDHSRNCFDVEKEMTKAGNICALTVILMLGLNLPAAAATEGEFDDNCAMGLALGKEIKTDCSVNTVYAGKTYCFGNETAKQLFLKKPDEFLLKAQIFYSSKPPQ